MTSQYSPHLVSDYSYLSFSNLFSDFYFSLQYKEAFSRLQPAWMTRLVLGGYGQSDWPADRMVLKVRNFVVYYS